MSGGTRSWAGRRTDSDGRILEAVRRAREAVPRYGVGPPLSADEVHRLTDRCGLRVHRAVREMDAPAVLLPPIAGAHRLVLAPGLGPDAARFVVLHEVGHVLAGDADEIILLRATGAVPDAERVADGFALLGFLGDAELLREPEWLEARLRERVQLDDPVWIGERVARLAASAGRLRKMLG